MKKQSQRKRLKRTLKSADIYSDKLSEGSGRCPENPQGTRPLTHYRALPEPILAGRQEKGAVAPFLQTRIIRELYVNRLSWHILPAAPVPVFHGSIDNSSAPVLRRLVAYSGWFAGRGRLEVAIWPACCRLLPEYQPC